MLIVSYGLRPGCALANELCPGGCQSCVAKAWSKWCVNWLIARTTEPPSATASSPPGMKVGCTSTKPRMSVVRSIIGLAPRSVLRDDSRERTRRGHMALHYLKQQRAVTDALRRSVTEDLPELADIGDAELRR